MNFSTLWDVAISGRWTSLSTWRGGLALSRRWILYQVVLASQDVGTCR